MFNESQWQKALHVDNVIVIHYIDRTLTSKQFLRILFGANRKWTDSRVYSFPTIFIRSNEAFFEFWLLLIWALCHTNTQNLKWCHSSCTGERSSNVSLSVVFYAEVRHLSSITNVLKVSWIEASVKNQKDKAGRIQTHNGEWQVAWSQRFKHVTTDGP